jgi:hypothetical protein
VVVLLAKSESDRAGVITRELLPHGELSHQHTTGQDRLLHEEVLRWTFNACGIISSLLIVLVVAQVESIIQC